MYSLLFSNNFNTIIKNLLKTFLFSHTITGNHSVFIKMLYFKIIWKAVSEKCIYVQNYILKPIPILDVGKNLYFIENSFRTFCFILNRTYKIWVYEKTFSFLGDRYRYTYLVFYNVRTSYISIVFSTKTSLPYNFLRTNKVLLVAYTLPTARSRVEVSFYLSFITESGIFLNTKTIITYIFF